MATRNKSRRSSKLAEADDSHEPTPEFIEAQRQKLLELRAELLAQSSGTKEYMKHLEREVGDSVDTSTDEQGMTHMLMRGEREQQALLHIERALERIEQEEYGECQECGEYIAARRLQVRPTALLCVDCQEDQEQIERSHRSRPGLIDE